MLNAGLFINASLIKPLRKGLYSCTLNSLVYNSDEPTRMRMEHLKRLNANHFFKEPIKFDGAYFVPSGKPGLGYEYDEKFVVSRERLA